MGQTGPNDRDICTYSTATSGRNPSLRVVVQHGGALYPGTATTLRGIRGEVDNDRKRDLWLDVTDTPKFGGDSFEASSDDVCVVFTVAPDGKPLFVQAESVLENPCPDAETVTDAVISNG